MSTRRRGVGLVRPHDPSSVTEADRRAAEWLPPRRLHIVQDELVRDRERYPEAPRLERPQTRAECENTPRPCPFVGCRWHLYLEVNDKGHINLNFPHIEPEDMVDSCALDVADNGPRSLDEIGTVLNVTRERIRQIEERALGVLARRGVKLRGAVGEEP